MRLANLWNIGMIVWMALAIFNLLAGDIPRATYNILWAILNAIMILVSEVREQNNE